MFPKNHRFNRQNFSVCYEHGVKSHTKGITIIMCQQPVYTVAIVVPKKICPRATDRNALRRQLFHQLKSVVQGYGKQQGYIFLIKKEYIQANKAERATMVSEMITRIFKTTVQ